MLQFNSYETYLHHINLKIMFDRTALPPQCEQKPKELKTHGDIRRDPYYWLNERENEEVLDYLRAENAYTEQVLKPTEGLQEELYEEMRSRIKEDDESVPYFKNAYWYYTRFEQGREYPIYCRKHLSLEAAEEVMLDVNTLAEGKAYCQVGGLAVSPNNKLLSYGVDFESRRKYTIHILNLETGETLPESIEMTTGGSVWAADNDTLFYTTKDEQTLRSNKIHRFQLSSNSTQEVYEEKDERFYTSVGKTRSQKFIVIGSSSSTTSEMRFVSAESPESEFQVFAEREQGIEYGAVHFKDKWLILTNWEALNFRVMSCPLEHTSRANWIEEKPHREDVLVEGITPFKNFIVYEDRKDGLSRIQIEDVRSGESYFLPFEEEAYTCGVGSNPEFDTSILRFGYTSMTSPVSIREFHMESHEETILKESPVLGDFDKTNYVSERHFAVSHDGVQIPISLVRHKNTLPGIKTPLLLYAYGSYGNSMDPYFSSNRLSLLNRGFVFAIAHIRGGEELGRKWYEQGKMLQKKNTFQDFISCAEYFIEKGYTTPQHLYAMGGSAGGLLMGAVINMRPELWKGVVAQVPFVDVLTTMLDESIPLTTGEFEEWGNPKDEEFYHYIKSYSPYDNIEMKDYPNMLVTTGLHDSQVQYWEPAKWVARLRALKSDNNVLLLKTEMDYGHGGASGRFQRIKEIAMEYAFLLGLENG
jgi:oligopeptidase B